MTKYAIALVLALSATAAHAQPLTYMCNVGSRVYPVYVTKATLTWRGTTFRNLKEAPAGLGDSPHVCAKYGWTATNKNRVAATLCVATQGAGGLAVGKDEFECQIKSK